MKKIPSRKGENPFTIPLHPPILNLLSRPITLAYVEIFQRREYLFKQKGVK